LFWRDVNYFTTEAALKPLLHTWSLAVEEQYYMLFPLFLAVAWPRGMRVVFVLVGGATAISLVIAYWAATKYPNAGFFLLPARGWEILFGAIVAQHIKDKSPDKIVSQWVAQALSIIGLILVLIPIFLFTLDTANPVFLMLPAGGTVLLIVFARKGTVAHTVLSCRPLVTIGLISYSAYLWHQPIFSFTRSWLIVEPPPLIMATLSIGIFILAYGSWKLVETPFRNGLATSRAAILLVSVGGSLSCIVFGLTGHFGGGFPVREEALSLKDYQPDNYILETESLSVLRSLSHDPGYGYTIAHNAFDDELWFDLSDPRKRLLVVGNSHSIDIFNTLYFSNEAKLDYQIARYGIQLDNILSNSKFFESPNYRTAHLVMLATR
jgi:hypothetical protein